MRRLQDVNRSLKTFMVELDIKKLIAPDFTVSVRPGIVAIRW